MAEGVVLTVIGMTVVFAFLILLVCVMYTISLVARVLPSVGPGAGHTTAAESEVAIAIAIAHAHARMDEMEQEQ
ncbi:MAG: sodium pump decarboxylase [Spirochaetaceae bacterium]|nr:MAG: sodium pump decarboxylase [Spirochaetaceae bacterium]